MAKISGRHLCLFLLAFTLSWADESKKYVGTPENPKVCSQAKTRQLFARQKTSQPQETQVHKQKLNPVTPPRRCSRLLESCSSSVPCCNPCASCRCRLFNTICHCWRMNPLCPKKT